jgi:hypothetical protein
MIVPMLIFLLIVLAMILYDFSVHLIFLMDKGQWFIERGLNYWPEWKGNKAKLYYQRFWSIYWGSAVVLIVLYLLTK